MPGVDEQQAVQRRVARPGCPNPVAIVKAPAIPALTGIRFFLALFVVIFHFGLGLVSDAPAWARNVLGSGYTAVSMFFVLSGFVLGYNYLGDVKVRASRFWIARVARIGPAYWTALLIQIPFWIQELLPNHTTSFNYPLTTILVSLTCTQAWVIGTHAVWNMPAWSLSCEWFFYLLFPFIGIQLIKLRRNGLFCAMTVFAGLTLLVPLLYLLFQPDHISNASLTQENMTHFTRDTTLLSTRFVLWHDGWYRLALYNPIVHLPTFLLGMSVGRYRRIFSGPRSSGIRRVAVHLSAFAILTVLAISGRMPHILLHDCIVALLFCAFISQVTALWRPVQRLLSTRPLLILGEASYTMYILQHPLSLWFETILRHVFHVTGLEVYTFPILLEFVVVLVAASVLTSVFIEKPARKWIMSVR
jgi:peptidoglycan/LPS O-acetylase OafA/YrhL